MKLLYISPRDMFKARSDPIHIMASCKAFVQSGVEVELVAPYYIRPENMHPNKIFENYGIKAEDHFTIVHLPTNLRDESANGLVRLKKFLLYSLYAMKVFLIRREYKRYRHFFVYGKCYVSILPFIYLAKLLRLRNVITSFEVASFQRRSYEKLLLRRLDRIVAINPFLRKDIVETVGIQHEKILVPPLGVDDSFSECFEMSKEEARRELGIKNNEFIVLYSGKIYMGEDSEITLIFKAAKMVPEATFIFTGGKREAIDYYEKMARGMNIFNVRFTGFFDSPKEPFLFMKASNVLISFYPKSIPTLRHMVPNKIVQYARSKTVIIAARHPAIEFMLGRNGAIYVDPEDVDALARAIRDVMDQKVATDPVAENAYKKVIYQTYRNRSEAIISFLLFRRET